ncbi:DUF4179 domain-containing protein [Psychrobacillus sp.]|uniref:DUF4179 domain-containing protein n=1 Tax=Psychrobacillus sp. TaxID=1871623 RepID=UPI0028BEBC96|nr:DUF4179 domain-containing protein [Psychrobacillus sp.]
MNCPKADKLSQYVDNLLIEKEHAEIQTHIKSCEGCMRVVEAFKEEQQFIKETLQTPTLPDDFASIVLEHLEPYEQKSIPKRSKPWKRILLTAAGIVLALGITATFSPSFAQLIGGFFGSEQADEGLRIAMEEGLVERVNLEVTDNGMTLKVEDVVIDSSRVGLSFQVLNKDGKPLDTKLNLGLADSENENKIIGFDQNGKEINRVGTGWWEGSDYGFAEISLREQEAIEKLTVKFDLVELNGVSGNWQLEVPVDLKKMNKLTTTIPLNDDKTSSFGVAVNMEQVQFSASSTELLYETSFTKEESIKVNEDIKKLKKELGEGIINDNGKYDTSIQYHIENEDKKVIYYHNNYLADEADSNNLGMLQSSGKGMEQLGQVAWNESFVPQKDKTKLTLVLDGVYKKVPTDFSIKIKPKELNKAPVSFEYEGNFITIKKTKKQSEFSLRKSLIPVEKEDIFKIEMEGSRDALAPELGEWVLTDDKGKSYATLLDGSYLYKKDKSDGYELTMGLKSYDLKEVPDELTLHLISVTRFEEVKDKWIVPLY